MLNFPAAGGLNQPEDFWGQLIAQMRSPQGLPLSATMPIQDPHAFWGVPKPQIGALMKPQEALANSNPSSKTELGEWMPYSDYVGHWLINTTTGERRLVNYYNPGDIQGG